MKNIGKWGLALIIIGVFCFIMGITTDSSEVMREFSSDGGKTIAEFMPIFVAMAGFFCAICGAYFIVMNNKPTEKKAVKVLEVHKCDVMVEFNDSTRKKLINIAKIPVITGDIGIVEFKGNLLIAFTKN